MTILGQSAADRLHRAVHALDLALLLAKGSRLVCELIYFALPALVGTSGLSNPFALALGVRRRRARRPESR